MEKLEGGEVKWPLEVFTVAGNVLTLLGSVEAVGDGLYHSCYAVSAPEVRVSSLSVAGG